MKKYAFVFAVSDLSCDLNLTVLEADVRIEHT